MIYKKYYEFNKQDYYALIAVNPWPEEGLYPVDQAFKKYVECVGGETVEEVKAEGLPDEVSRDYALVKYAKIGELQNEPNEETLRTFNEGDLLIIDGSLV